MEAEYNMEQKPGDFEFAVQKVAECANNRYQVMLLLTIIHDMVSTERGGEWMLHKMLLLLNRRIFTIVVMQTYCESVQLSKP